jgi:hypothetical protein
MTGETLMIIIIGHKYINIGQQWSMMLINTKESHQFQPNNGAQKINLTNYKLFHLLAESEY